MAKFLCFECDHESLPGEIFCEHHLDPKNRVNAAGQPVLEDQPMTNTNNMSNFLPCPFCGADPEAQDWHGGPRARIFIQCPNGNYDDEHGGCSVGPQVVGSDMEDAAARWNRRHPQQAQGEWVRSDERLPTEDDMDDLGFVWAFCEWLGIIVLDRHSITEPPFYTHWKPTGLTQPQPPKTKEGSDEYRETTQA